MQFLSAIRKIKARCLNVQHKESVFALVKITPESHFNTDIGVLMLKTVREGCGTQREEGDWPTHPLF